MRRIRVGLALLALFFSSSPLTFAEEAEDAPYNAHSQPLLSRDLSLLSDNRYVVKPDGTVWSEEAHRAVLRGEMPALIERMEGAQRLKALVAMHMIFIRAGDDKLSAADNESIRKILRENWSLFSLQMRKEFKKYFTLPELEAMNRDLGPLVTFPRPEEPLPDNPLPIEDIISSLPPPAPVPAMPVASSAALPAVSTAPEIALSAPAAVSTQAVLASAPPISIAAPLMKPLALAALPPAVPPAPALTPPPAAPVPAPAPPPAAPVSPPPAPPTPAPPPTVTIHPPTTQFLSQAMFDMDINTFDKFLGDAPYSADVKELLRLISRKTPAAARRPAISALVALLPSIVVDWPRLSPSLRYELSDNRIALTPGPVVYTRKKLFFGASQSLILASGPTYTALGLPVPAVDALDRGKLPAERAKTEWGQTQSFEDESLRGTYSNEQLAGTLLRALLLLDAHRKAARPSEYQAELAARLAQWTFYGLLRDELGNDAFLDPDERASFEEWYAWPFEARDHLVHTLSAGRVAALGNSLCSPAAQTRQARLQDARALERLALMSRDDLKAIEKADAVQAAADPCAPNTVSGYGAYSPKSRALSCELPSNWEVFDEDEPSGFAVHAMGPDDEAGDYRAGIDIHWVESGRSGHVSVKEALEKIRRASASAHRPGGATIRRMSTPLGLARVMEVHDTRRVPTERAPSSNLELHHDVALIQSGESYYLVTLSAPEDSYVDYREVFQRVLRTLR